MGQFPIQHRAQALVADDDIAESEVPVHERRGPRRWTVVLQPTEDELEGGVRLAELVERDPVLLHLVDGRQRLERGGGNRV